MSGSILKLLEFKFASLKCELWLVMVFLEKMKTVMSYYLMQYLSLVS